MDFLDLLSTHFLICNEKIKGMGEDCGIEIYNESAGLIGAFDGCGGIGSKRCPVAGNKTEAYLASRTVGNAVKLWFDHCCCDQNYDLDMLGRVISICLDQCKKYSSDSSAALTGSLVKSYPSTLAVVVTYAVQGRLLTKHIWAGDSRTYFLDINGIAQVTEDDIYNTDALANLTGDGSLTNVISLGGEFALKSKTIEINTPIILLSASDGSFGYVSSPMEFEYMLLSTLYQSANVVQWEQNLNEEISSRSGDDQTLVLEALGFKSFNDMKNYFAGRFRYISEIYDVIENSVDQSVLYSIWDDYKINYYRFMN